MSTRKQLIVIDQELLRGRWTFPIAKPSDSNLPMPPTWRKNDKYWIPTTWNVTIGLDFTNIFEYNFYHSILKLYPLWPSGCFPLKWRSNLNKIIFGLSLYMTSYVSLLFICCFLFIRPFPIFVMFHTWHNLQSTIFAGNNFAQGKICLKSGSPCWISPLIRLIALFKVDGGQPVSFKTRTFWKF